MTAQETNQLNGFSTGFDTLAGSYLRKLAFGDQQTQDIEFDEYEKSVFLTEAQDELVIGLYNGTYKSSFETTEEMRRYLDNLVKTRVYTPGEQVEGDKVSVNSVFYPQPDDLAFITMEQVTFSDESLGCHDGSVVTVYPVTQDEYGRIKKNPFKGPSKSRVIRLDPGNGTVEIISPYTIGSYLMRYMSLPKPIILVDLPDGLTIKGESQATPCELNPVLHNTILENAVQLALAHRGIQAKKENS